MEFDKLVAFAKENEIDLTIIGMDDPLVGGVVDAFEAEGLRDKYIVCCGGARITHELAKELGYDAGFGAGKYADDVATFAVTDMVKRGFK